MSYGLESLPDLFAVHIRRIDAVLNGMQNCELRLAAFSQDTIYCELFRSVYLGALVHAAVTGIENQPCGTPQRLGDLFGRHASEAALRKKRAHIQVREERRVSVNPIDEIAFMRQHHDDRFFRLRFRPNMDLSTFGASQRIGAHETCHHNSSTSGS